MLHISLEIISGILIPFLGTSLGAAWVFFMRETFNPMLQKILAGFAAGVMTAASVWSLLIPAIEQSDSLGQLAFLPAVVGFGLGILFLLWLDYFAIRLHQGGRVEEEYKGEQTSMATENDGNGQTNLERENYGNEQNRMVKNKYGSEQGNGRRKKTGSREPYKRMMTRAGKMVLAVTLHNIPEGMAVGVIFAGMLSGNGAITMAEALALSIGIAIQNIPEGAIVSLPLRAEGSGRGRAFLYGVLSGIVEPLAAGLTVLASSFILSVLPYLLSFAAGAMIYVVVEELIPEMSDGSRSHMGILSFAAGFILMLALDVALG